MVMVSGKSGTGIWADIAFILSFIFFIIIFDYLFIYFFEFIQYF